MVHDKMISDIKNFIVALFAAIILVTSIGCVTDTQPAQSATNASEIAPAAILGMEKMVVSTGMDALQRVKRSHTGSIENVEDLAIIHYGKDDKLLTLWVTLYQNGTVARTETERMVIGMRKWGGDWASTLEEVTIDDKVVYRVMVNGEPQYFWADGRCVLYIIPHNFTHDEISLIIKAIP
ncbi:MAG: hypothetical protein ACXQTO_05670 [Candidatus Syntropharchaeales archaeon]